MVHKERDNVKILYTANTDMHINLCHIPYIKELSKKHIVHVATNSFLNINYASEKISLPIKRTPFHFSNIKAIFKLRKIIKQEKYDLIITNTPMGSVVTRLAAKGCKIKTIYIAHGFHFYKNCPKINYLLYYPVEKYLSKFTNLIITINQEDYLFAIQHFKTNIKFIPGIGFNQNNFNNKLTSKEILILKNKLGITKNDFVISYIAEISKRKRQLYLLECLSKLNNSNIKLVLVGNNILGNKIDKTIKKYNLEDNVILLGFRNDISDILDITDLVISTSKQEGLPLNIMEAMYKNKNILVTDCRGNRDLINNDNGKIVNLNDQNELIEGINYFIKNKEIKYDNKKTALNYSIDNIKMKYINIFNDYLGVKNEEK